MRAGLPIDCSERSAMSELLQNCGVCFNPNDPNLRCSMVSAAKEMSARFSWERCADETFEFFKTTLSRA